MSQQWTVLIVDDDVAIAEVTCEVVQLAGVQAVYRTGVLDAIDFIARNHAEIIALLTDINLASAMSGIELAIHVAQEWPAIAICAVSGLSGERPRRLPETAAYLSKPWQSDDVLAFVTAAMPR